MTENTDPIIVTGPTPIDEQPVMQGSATVADLMAQGPAAEGPGTLLRPGGLAPSVHDREIGVNDGKQPTAPLLARAHERINARNQVVAANWQKRIQEEGKRMYVCPLERGPKRQRFETPDECLTYMQQQYPTQLAAAKASGTVVQPREILVAPKRRLEDFYPPEVAERMRRLHEGVAQAHKRTAGIQQSMNHPSKTLKMLHAPETEQMAQVPHLGTDELQALGREASKHGKTNLARLVRRTLKGRGVNAAW